MIFGFVLRRTVLMFLLLAATVFGAGRVWSQTNSVESQCEQRLQWWQAARFGIFIHWGISSVAAGEWDGREIPGASEWIMNKARIPVKEYACLAARFDPVKFNADQWVRLIKESGAEYLVITAKHHDGFAMFDSKASPYNIVDATPFHRDPMKALVAACRKQGIKLGFYYSHVIDWHEPDAVGNDWDFPATNRDFTKSFEGKVLPQVRELLTHYGPVGVMWFDVWFDSAMTPAQARQLENLVHQLQPDCIVNGRVGYGLGDYDEADDNQISVGDVRRAWETPVTMNDSWGFKKSDTHWKSASVLIQQLARIVSHGGNYLLNIGPTGEGEIPPASVERLQAIGRWMDQNVDSIRGCGASPFANSFSWGVATSKPGKLYLHIFNWPNGRLELYGIRGKVTRAYLLSDTNRAALKVSQSARPAIEFYDTSIQLPPTAPDARDSVVALEFAGDADVIPAAMQAADGVVSLNAHLAKIHHAAVDSSLRINGRDFTEHWINTNDWLSWQFQVFRPGVYDVEMLTTEEWSHPWKGGHQVRVMVDKNKVRGKLERDGEWGEPNNPYMTNVVSHLGQVTINRTGDCELTLRADRINTDKEAGLTVVTVKLVPAGPGDFLRHLK